MADTKEVGKDKPLVALPAEAPSPKDNPTTPEKVALGKQLFFDKRLSGDNKQEDNYKFRTPSLRNVELTGPYMHDGSQKTLEDVVIFYYRGASTAHPEGLPLDVKPLLGQSFSEIAPIVAFLKSLTGKAPEISMPDLP